MIYNSRLPTLAALMRSLLLLLTLGMARALDPFHVVFRLRGHGIDAGKSSFVLKVLCRGRGGGMGNCAVGTTPRHPFDTPCLSSPGPFFP